MTQHPDGNCGQLSALVAELARRLDAQALVLARIQADAVETRLKVDGLDGWMCASAARELEASEPEPGVISAETRRSDAEILLGMAERTWPEHEYLDIRPEGGDQR